MGKAITIWKQHYLLLNSEMILSVPGRAIGEDWLGYVCESAAQTLYYISKQGNGDEKVIYTNNQGD